MNTMRAILGLLLAATLIGTANAYGRGPAKPVAGNGAYVPGTGYKYIRSVTQLLGAVGACVPRSDGSWNDLSIRAQCGSFPTTLKGLPQLGGPNQIWNWICYAALLKAPEGATCVTDVPVVTGPHPALKTSTDGTARVYYTNWYTANKAKDAALILEISAWTEKNILSKPKTLFEALSAPNKQYIVDAMMAALISEYIQDSTSFNAFQWLPPNPNPDGVHIAKEWKARALLVALRSRPSEVAGNVVYRGRELRGTALQQTTAYTAGNVVWEKGFASATQEEDQAYGYTRPESVNAEIVEITASANSRGHVLGTKLTKEVLFEPSARFRVTALTCDDDVDHDFIHCGFTTCAAATHCQQPGNTDCTATWNKVCRIQLQEIDPHTYCNAGGSFMKVCVEPVQFERSYWKIQKVLGYCDFAGKSLTAAPLKIGGHGATSCQRAAVCRTAAGDYEAVTKQVNAGNCAPTAGGSAIYYVPGAGALPHRRQLFGRNSGKANWGKALAGVKAANAVKAASGAKASGAKKASAKPAKGASEKSGKAASGGSKKDKEPYGDPTLGRPYFPKDAAKLLKAESAYRAKVQKTDDVDEDGVDDSMENGGGEDESEE